MGVNPLRGGAGDVNQGVKVRLREEHTELVENPLAATHPGQPIVDEGDPHRGAG